MAIYGIIYGGQGRTDYAIDAEYHSIEEARAAYDAAKRITYRDGLTGGAEIVEVRRAGADQSEPWEPVCTVERIAPDEQPEAAPNVYDVLRAIVKLNGSRLDRDLLEAANAALAHADADDE